MKQSGGRFIRGNLAGVPCGGASRRINRVIFYSSRSKQRSRAGFLPGFFCLLRAYFSSFFIPVFSIASESGTPPT